LHYSEAVIYDHGVVHVASDDDCCAHSETECCQNLATCKHSIRCCSVPLPDDVSSSPSSSDCHLQQSVELEAVCTDVVNVTDDAADADLLCNSISEHCHLICRKLHSVMDVAERQRLCHCLSVLLEFYETQYLLDDGASTEHLFAFPHHLLEQYTSLVKDDIGFYSGDGFVKLLLTTLLYWTSI